MYSILDRTDNFLDLYVHCCGRSEVPQAFHEWTCLTLIAACAGNRVWYEKIASLKLTPNLYTFLIGPSGCGKGQAIDLMLSLVYGIPNLSLFVGKITAQGMYDVLKSQPSTFLITPELANDIGEGSTASQFIKTMTDLYTGSPVAAIQERTRTKGVVLLKDHCVNWVAGTTKRWLMETVTESAVTGGFFGRTVPVFGELTEERYRRPIYPHDRDLVLDHLRTRVLELCHIEGVFTFSAEAEDVEQRWYDERERPGDENLFAAWKRQHDMSLKLAMILSLSDNLDLVVYPHHMIAAQQWSDFAMRNMPELVTTATTAPSSNGIKAVADLIKSRKRVHHATLLQAMYRKGVDAEEMRKILFTLEQAKLIAASTDVGSRVYVWAGARRLLADADGKGDSDE